MIYEPPDVLNTAKAGDVQPWGWPSPTPGTPTHRRHLQLRTGVTLERRQAVHRRDVAFITFNLTQDTGLNTNGLPVKNTVAQGDDTVTVTFTKPAYQNWSTSPARP